MRNGRRSSETAVSTLTDDNAEEGPARTNRPRQIIEGRSVHAFDLKDIPVRAGRRDAGRMSCLRAGRRASPHRDREAHRGRPAVQDGCRRAPEGSRPLDRRGDQADGNSGSAVQGGSPCQGLCGDAEGPRPERRRDRRRRQRHGRAERHGWWAAGGRFRSPRHGVSRGDGCEGQTRGNPPRGSWGRRRQQWSRHPAQYRPRDGRGRNQDEE